MGKGGGLPFGERVWLDLPKEMQREFGPIAK